MKFKLSEIEQIVNGSAILSQDAVIDEYVYDSRKFGFSENAMFLAIKTTGNDGHLFISDMMKKGIRNFMVQEIPSIEDVEGCNFIKVPNTLQAFQELAGHVRSISQLKAVGITGSNGKTVVKEWLAEMLKNTWNVVKTPHSYNSQLGVPISLMQI